MSIIKRVILRTPVLTQAEKVTIIKSWTKSFELRNIRNIASIQASNKDVFFFCRLEGIPFQGRTKTYDTEEKAVNEALHIIKDMVETEVTQMIGELLR